MLLSVRLCVSVLISLVCLFLLLLIGKCVSVSSVLCCWCVIGDVLNMCSLL